MLLKSIKDLGDKADKAEVDKVNDAVGKLKETLKTDDVEKIKEDTMKLTEVAEKLQNKFIKSKQRMLSKIHLVRLG